jgi:hypothetical protein
MFLVMFSLLQRHKEHIPMIPEDLPFRVIRVNSEDEVLARAANLVIGRAAFETARRVAGGPVKLA